MTSIKIPELALKLYLQIFEQDHHHQYGTLHKL